MSGLPPLPPGAKLDEPLPPLPSGATLDRSATPPDFGQVEGAVDGDTLRMSRGPNLRLWGIDAPELRQRGYRDGASIPIGELSRGAITDFLGRGTPRLGEIVMQSYGRPVAPVTVGGNDTGRYMLRSGNAFAAPDYLSSDPERRFDYMQAERLARQNRLGVHGVTTQSPADYRANPDYVPERRTVGMAWDTPTPFAGLSAEGEQEWLRTLATGTADQIEAKARDLGFSINTDRNREWVEWRDKEKAEGREVPLSVIYERGPDRPLTDAGDGATGAAVRGLGSGFMVGALDELGAVADTLGGTPGRENVWNSDRRLADIWLNNQTQNASILGYDREYHPYASTTGEVVGAIGSGFVVPYAAGARTMPQLARVGAAYGGVEGFMDTDGSLGDRVTGAAIGVPIGMVADPLLGKAVEIAAPGVRRAVRGTVDAGRFNAGRALALARSFRSRNRAQEASEGAAQEGGEVFMESEAIPALRGDLPPLPEGARINYSPFRPQRMDEPLTEAQRAAAAENITPGDVLPIPGNTVRNVDEAAARDAERFAQARPIDERSELSRQPIRNYRGEDVPKVGPLDMVGWLRSRGGLVDQGGELRHMGIVNNAPRRGMDHVGQETRFGPILNDEGMTLDDAAFAAWEAGYFPELPERPTTSQFLDALRETYEGGAGRRFLPQDAAELDAFDARQMERYDLEQRQFEEGGPIYQDRSSAADAQPFPPVRAYEEWPDGGPDFAGNIRLDKLDSPQDIKRALDQTERRIGFDAATRGRVTNAETERLASELNMTAEQLLSRRKGQAFNAEEALAARQILAKSGNELVNAARQVRRKGDNPGSEALAEFRQKWMRHVAIQEQVAGMTAEAGRALQQFRQAASSREVRGDVLDALVRGGGGKETMIDAADALIEASEVSPGVFNALADKARQPKWRDKIGELYINFLLSNPPTHVVNMVSNTLTALAQIPEHAAGAAIGGLRRGIMGKAAQDRILASEVGARTIGLIQGAKEGARLMARALRTGDPDDFTSKVEGDQFRAIGGFKGEVIRVPTRLLTAEDQFFKGVARRMELNAQAVRIANREGLTGEAAKRRIAELSANPTDEMIQRSLNYGKYLTFQQKLGEAGRHISGFTGSNLPAKVVIPFVRTPINLMKFATERSIAAPLLKEWRADMMAGGARRDMAVARMLLGTGFAAMFYEAALNGQITGAVPPDPAKARLLYAEGWQPYSIKVGDRYVSYTRLDPFSTTLGVAADMATLPDGLSERQQDDKAMLVVASIMGNLASKTWLSGLSAFTEALSDPGRYADNFVQRTAGSFAVPAGVAGVARALDPVSRKRATIGEAIRARVPGQSQELMPRRDVFGEVITYDNLGPDFLSPFWQSQDRDDPVVAEMLRIGKSVSAPGTQYTEDGERRDYEPEVYDRYHEIAGRLTYNALLGLIASPQYERMDDVEREDAASEVIRDARAAAREVLDDPDYPLPERGASPAGAPAGDLPPLPPGARMDGLPPLPSGARLN